MSMRQAICPVLCRYYKPGKREDPGCGGVEWLKQRPHLQESVAGLSPLPHDELFNISDQDPRLLAVCEACEFRIDGCDFRDPEVPRSDCSPCGGLRAIAGLLSAGLDLEI